MTTQSTLIILILAMFVAVFFLVGPASAATPTALSISITESASQANNYTPSLNPEYLNATGGSVTNGTISGSGTVTINNTLTNTDLYDVTVNFTLGQTSSASWAWVSGPSATITINGGIVTVHFAKLPHGTPATLSYTLLSSAHLPLYLIPSYNTSDVPDAVGQQALVTLTLVKDETTSGPCTLTNIGVISTNALSGAGWATPAWTFIQSSTASGSINTNGNIVTWLPASMSPEAANETATYVANLANTSPFTAATNTPALQLFNMTNDVLSYQINGSQTASGVNVVGSPTATTLNVGMQMTKTYVPGTGYQFIPIIWNNQSSPDNIAFNLTAVNFWIVNNNNVAGTPTYNNSTSSGWPTLPTLITSGQSWTGPTITENPGYVPAGFMQPLISVADTGNQIQRTYNSQNGTVTLLQTIYILNGYKILVTKSVTANATSGFDIKITVQNVGTLVSPNVYVYDIVPSGWSATNFNNTPMNGLSGTNVVNPINGVAYYWNESSIQADSYGLNQTYTVIGPANYPLSQVFVVGVDPAQSVNIQTSPMLSNVASMASDNFEPLAAAGALVLIVFGMIGTVRRRL